MDVWLADKHYLTCLIFSTPPPIYVEDQTLAVSQNSANILSSVSIWGLDSATNLLKSVTDFYIFSSSHGTSPYIVSNRGRHRDRWPQPKSCYLVSITPEVVLHGNVTEVLGGQKI